MHPYQKQYDEQLAYLKNLEEGLPVHSTTRVAIVVARIELVREGPGNNGMLSCFLREVAEKLLDLEKAVCSIPVEETPTEKGEEV